MEFLYASCPCGSGKKTKFCCNEYFVNISNAVKQQGPIRMPVRDCLVGKGYKEMGMASIIISRGFTDQAMLVGVYLIDIWCLGLKDTDLKKKLNQDLFEELCDHIAQGYSGLSRIAYEDARSIILGGIKYAASMGFSPQKDWEQTRHIIEFDREFNDTFKFGRDGKPHYFAGPHDKKVCKEYVQKVIAAGGNWTVPLDYEI